MGGQKNLFEVAPRAAAAAFFGPVHLPPEDHSHAPVSDLNARELVALAPLLTLCLVIGLFPLPLINVIEPDVEAVAKLYRFPETLLQKTASLTPSPSTDLGSEIRP